jgi:multidrug efflux system outer membrane protein
MNSRALGLIGLIALSGCVVGPNYTKPDVPAPPQFRYSNGAGKESLADTKFGDLFEDPVLTSLIGEAIRNNFDLNIAAERVLEARASLGIMRSQFYPQLSGNAQFDTGRGSSVGATPYIAKGTDLSLSYTQVGFSVYWELDVWGRIRRLNESAKAQYLASEEGRHAVLTTLISDVTSTYLGLRELDLELEISKRTRDIAANSLKLINLRHDRGAATGLDVSQAQQFLYTATAQIASVERSIAQTEDSLNLLLGRSPGDIARGKALEQITAPAAVPAGLPSALLDRRPDIRQAEQQLISANAQIGVAKAAYFPQISLTGLLGAQSRQLTNLFTGPAALASLAPGATQTIFDAGRIRNNVRLTEAQQRELLVNYQKTIQNAFREVSDALAGYAKTGEQRSQQEKLVQALNESDRLSTLRYRGGRAPTISGRVGFGAAPPAGARVRRATLPRARRRLAIIIALTRNSTSNKIVPCELYFFLA